MSSGNSRVLHHHTPETDTVRSVQYSCNKHIKYIYHLVTPNTVGQQFKLPAMATPEINELKWYSEELNPLPSMLHLNTIVAFCNN
jgi:hypothetical protein